MLYVAREATRAGKSMRSADDTLTSQTGHLADRSGRAVAPYLRPVEAIPERDYFERNERTRPFGDTRTAVETRVPNCSAGRAARFDDRARAVRRSGSVWPRADGVCLHDSRSP